VVPLPPSVPTVTARLSKGLTVTVPDTIAPSPPAELGQGKGPVMPPWPPTAVIVTLVTPAGTVNVSEAPEA
jgi:hypothetical protein